jgi:transcriptional regulator with XRE-family HTH domain
MFRSGAERERTAAWRMGEARRSFVSGLYGECGGSTETIYSLEHGRRDFIWPKTARKLAGALGVDPDDLYR